MCLLCSVRPRDLGENCEFKSESRIFPLAQQIAIIALRSWQSCEKAENSISGEGGGEFDFWRHVGQTTDRNSYFSRESLNSRKHIAEASQTQMDIFGFEVKF